MKLQSLSTLITVANAVELGVEVAKKVIGNEVSDMLEGSELTNDTIRQHVVTEFQNSVNKNIGK